MRIENDSDQINSFAKLDSQRQSRAMVGSGAASKAAPKCHWAEAPG
jgi:hypothetical protein